MKKIVVALLGILFFTSCEKEKSKYEFTNSEQQKFVSFINEINTYGAKNDIEQEELKKENQGKIDSISRILMVNNWKGQISEISTFEVGKSTELSFVISFDIGEADKISFKTIYLLDNNKKETDFFFNKVKNLYDHSTVYFDGFISTDLLGNTEYFNENSFYSPLGANKDYYFNTINISDKITPKFSENLIKSNTIAAAVFDLLDKKVRKKISNSNWDKETKKLTEEAKKIELTSEEKSINDTYRKYLYFKFMDLQ